MNTNKAFRTWDVDQAWMSPPSVLELVPAGHLAHLVRDTVRDSLDLSEILDEYVDPGVQCTSHGGLL